MEALAHKLRSRIALYRRYLRDGLDGDLGAVYLEEIGKAEAELARLMGGGPESGAESNAR
jgi:hypothetical protein